MRAFEEARPVEVGELLERPLTGLLVSGIVNPFGPTLNAVVLAGEREPPRRVPVVRVMLNPFAQRAWEVGEAAGTGRVEPFEGLLSLPGLRDGSCPSLLVPSRELGPDGSLAFHAEFLRGFADARGVLERVRRWFGDPFGRVGEEVDGAEELLEETAAPFEEGEARELARLLLSPRHARPEIEALCVAWEGSIEFARENGGAGRAAGALPLKGFLAAYGRVTSGCVLPG